MTRTQLIAYRFRLYPTKEQLSVLLLWLELCRKLYNHLVAERIDHHRLTGKSIGYYEQKRALIGYKDEHPEYLHVHSQVLQDVVGRVATAFKNFFDGRTGYPRFKKYGKYRSITFPQATGSMIGRNSVLLPKIGRLRMVKHRAVKGKAKTITVVQYPSGQWHVIIIVELVVKEPHQRQITFLNPVGVDSGLRTYAYLSDGSTIENPRFTEKHGKRIKKAQRRLSRKVKVEKTVGVEPGQSHTLKLWSNNWVRAKRILAKNWQDYDNEKTDWQWKQANGIVRKYDFIAYENLPIKNMMKNHNLARSIQDAAWGGFWSKVGYKAVMAGSTTKEVPPRYSTQRCNVCGCRNHVSLSERTYRCRNCGYVGDRDYNASKTILHEALVGMDVPEFTPVEIGPLPPDTVMMEASLVVEAGNKFHARGRTSDKGGDNACGSPHALAVGGHHIYLPWSRVESWSCKACGECCKWFSIPLTPHEYAKISQTCGHRAFALGLGKAYLRKRDDERCVFQFELYGRWLCGLLCI